MAKFKNNFLITIGVLFIVSCGSIGKLKPAPAIYDFGINQNLMTSDIAVLNMKASDALTTNRIRYRLNYQNPSQVFYYADSVWSATPENLIKQKLNIPQITTTQQSCGLNLEISAFDHVFMSETKSEGVVILKAQILAKINHMILAYHIVEGKQVAHSNDAQGGVAAISKASEYALQAAFDWARVQTKNNALCQ